MARDVKEFVGRYTSAVEACAAANSYEDRNWGYFARAHVERATPEAYPKEEPGTYLVWGSRASSCD